MSGADDTLPPGDANEPTRHLPPEAASSRRVVAGRFRLLERLGRGGFGEVYRAHDSLLEREVALKLLDRQALGEGEAATSQQIVAEARIAARLDHPHVVPLYDAGIEDGVTWLAMKLIRGRGLDKILAAGPLAVTRAAELVRQVAEGLRYAHGQGFVHRDIKPGNILVESPADAQDHAWIVDFGLARALPTASFVASGPTVGTLPYMPPEQVAGGRVDQRSDLFSLGCVAYELLCGQRSFPGETLATVWRAIDVCQPDFSPLEDRVPGPLVAVVRRCLERAPEARFQSADDVLAALSEISSDAHGRTTSRTPATGERRQASADHRRERAAEGSPSVQRAAPGSGGPEPPGPTSSAAGIGGVPRDPVRWTARTLFKAVVGAAATALATWLLQRQVTATPPELSAAESEALVADLRPALRDGIVDAAEAAGLDHFAVSHRVPPEIVARARAQLEPALLAAARQIQEGGARARSGAADLARVSFLTATRLDPGNAAAWASLGGALLDLGDPAEAEAPLLRAVSLDANSLVAHYNLAACRAAQGREDEALAELERALDLYCSSGRSGIPAPMLRSELQDAPQFALLREHRPAALAKLLRHPGLLIEGSLETGSARCPAG